MTHCCFVAIPLTIILPILLLLSRWQFDGLNFFDWTFKLLFEVNFDNWWFYFILTFPRCKWNLKKLCKININWTENFQCLTHRCKLNIFRSFKVLTIIVALELTLYSSFNWILKNDWLSSQVYQYHQYCFIQLSRKALGYGINSYHGRAIRWLLNKHCAIKSSLSYINYSNKTLLVKIELIWILYSHCMMK